MVIVNFPRLTYRYKQRIVNWEEIMRRKHYFVFFENFDQVWQLKLKKKKKKYQVLFIWNIVKLYCKLLFSEIIGTLMTRGEIVEKYKVYNVHTVGTF